jgi:acetoin utilization deacetylase AcuC-like enzyme
LAHAAARAPAPAEVRRLRLWSSAAYVVPLPEGHRFPIAKYARLRERVVSEGIVPASALHDPDRAPLDALRRVHTDDYLDRFAAGTLSDAEVRRLGFPWSAGLVERSLRATGGTLAASRAALADGLAMNLAGGTHHAFPDHGEGFCVFNDVAVAIRAMQDDGLARRAAVLDLDVHQGNGTHHIFAGDEGVFTFSMHGRRNYPFHKVPGTLDVELEDGTGDDEYLERLAEVLPSVLERSAPDIVFYLAGADPHEGDRLGRLKMTFDGLARRDRLVLETCRAIGLPVVIVIAGGYGTNIDDTVTVHVNTARIAADLLQRP